MGFLIRMAFWFSLVLLALPLDSGEPGVGPVQAFFAAKAAVDDVAAICERQPGVCETGKAAFHTIGNRAREGARVAFEMLDEDKAPAGHVETTGSIPAAPVPAEIPLPAGAPAK